MCAWNAACCSCCEEYSLLTSAGCSFTDCHNSLSDFIKIRPHTLSRTHSKHTSRETGKEGRERERESESLKHYPLQIKHCWHACWRTHTCSSTHTYTAARRCTRCVWTMIWWAILNVWPWVFPLPSPSQKTHFYYASPARFRWLMKLPIASQRQARHRATPVNGWLLRPMNPTSVLLFLWKVSQESCQCPPSPIWRRFVCKHNQSVFIMTVRDVWPEESLQCGVEELYPTDCESCNETCLTDSLND